MTAEESRLRDSLQDSLAEKYPSVRIERVLNSGSTIKAFGVRPANSAEFEEDFKKILLREGVQSAPDLSGMEQQPVNGVAIPRGRDSTLTSATSHSKSIPQRSNVVRGWKFKSERSSIQSSVVALESDTVTVINSRGQKVKLSLNRFSKRQIEFLRSQAVKQELSSPAVPESNSLLARK